MKKRHLKKWVKDTIFIIVMFIICFGSLFLLSYNAEQYDKKINTSNNNIYSENV